MTNVVRKVNWQQKKIQVSKMKTNYQKWSFYMRDKNPVRCIAHLKIQRCYQKFRFKDIDTAKLISMTQLQL